MFIQDSMFAHVLKLELNTEKTSLVSKKSKSYPLFQGFNINNFSFNSKFLVVSGKRISIGSKKPSTPEQRKYSKGILVYKIDSEEVESERTEHLHFMIDHLELGSSCEARN